MRQCMTLVESIIEITSTFGAEILLDANRFCAILGDMAPTLNKERKILRRAKDENVFPLILEAYYADAIKRNSLLSKVEYVLRTEAGFSDEWISVIIESFSEAFCWNSPSIKESKEITSTPQQKKDFLKFLSKQDVKKQFARVPYDFLIPDGYNVICEKAFTYENLKQVHSIIIPDSVVEIQSRAFYSIKINGYVEIPKSVESIGENAFYLGEGAFIKCDKESYAYEYCVARGIKTSIDTNKIEHQINRIVADNMKAELYNSDRGYSMRELIVPLGIQSIERGAFSKRQDIESVFSWDCIFIKKHAFSECKGLKAVSLGPCTRGIASDAFKDCTNLEVVYLQISDRDIELWKSLGELDEPLSISDTAFVGCTKLRFIVSFDYCRYLDNYCRRNGLVYLHRHDEMGKYMNRDLYYNLFLDVCLRSDKIYCGL